MGRISDAWKALTLKRVANLPLPYSGRGQYGYVGNAMPPGAKFDYVREAGDLWRNSTVSACLGWLQDNFCQARLCVKREAAGEAQEVEIEDHPLSLLLGKPNDHYSPDEFWDSLITAFKCDGNAYIIKARGMGGLGQPMQLWPVPPWMIEPYTDPSSNDFVTSYQYTPGNGGTYYLPRDQVVHLKASPDPYDGRKGCARLKHAIRNVVGLNRAETYTASVIGNGGVSRIFIPDPSLMIDDVVAEGVKDRYERATRGENAGRVPVMSVPGTFEQVGSGPQELSLDTILDRPEATICASLGVPAMVVGLAVGDSTRTFSNLKEAESQAWTNGLIPMQGRFARGLAAQLLPDFGDAKGLKLEWDRKLIVALHEDANDRAGRAVTLRTGGIISLNEARSMCDLDPVDGGDVTPAEEAEQGREQAAMIANGGAGKTGDDETQNDFGGQDPNTDPADDEEPDQ